MSDNKIIKISLVLSGEDNVVEFHRILPESYFEGCKIDLFSNEIDSLREEAFAQQPELKDYKEYIRIAAIDKETGEIVPPLTPPDV
jgi:hypothetical protein